MAAHPEDDSHRDKHQEDHRRDQQPPLPDAAHPGEKRCLDTLRIGLAILRLMAVGLQGANFVHRFVDVGPGIGHAILAGAREPAHAPAEQDDRQQHHRQAGKHQERELEAGEHEQDQRANAEHAVAQRHGETRADHRLQHRRIVGQAGDDLTGAGDLEKARRKGQQVIENLAPDIGGDALADPRHVVEADIGRNRHGRNDGQQGHQRLVERARVVAQEASVDHQFQALADRERASGGD